MSTLVRYYRIFLGGTEIAKIKNKDLKIKFGNKIIRLDQVAGFIGTADAKSYGLVPEIAAVTFEVDVASLWGVYLPDYVTTVTSGSDTAYYGGTRLIDLFSDAKELLIHPGELALSDRSQDMTFWKSTINPEGLELMGDQEAFQEVNLNLEVFPDENRADTDRYFCIGDPTITDTPLAVWIQENLAANTPAFQATVYTLATSQNAKFQCFALYGDIVDTATGAIDDATDITAADTAIIYDTLAGGTFIADTYYKIENEYIYVTAVVASSSVAGTLTAVRGVCDSTAAIHLDDVVITQVTGQSVVNHTKEATWDSSDETKAEVGDTFNGTGTANKGVIFWVATGTANITATHSSVASSNLAITAS